MINKIKSYRRARSLKSLLLLHMDSIWRVCTLQFVTISLRNCNGFNAIDLAKQLGSREIILLLTQYLTFAEQNLLKQQLKKSKLDPKYIDNYWLLRQKYGWRADWLDWNNRHIPDPLFWNTSRSMESLSTKDEFDDDLRLMNKIAAKDRKLALDPITGLMEPVINREKALTNKEEIQVLAGHNGLSRLDSLSLRRKIEEERLNRAMSMYNLPSRKYFENPILNRPPIVWNDDDSVTSSMIFDHDLQSNIKKMQKQRTYQEALKPNDRYVDQLMLSDGLFYGDPYEDLWQRETYSWFRNKNSKKEMPKQSDASQAIVHNVNNSTLSRRMSKIDKLESEEQAIKQQHADDPQITNNGVNSATKAQYKLPPIPNQRKESYDAWVKQQEQLKK